MCQKIEVSRGVVVGIGKVKIPRTHDFDYEIPMLAFLVIRDEQGEYIASCMHLRIDGYGIADNGAVYDMIENIGGFLKSNFAKLPLDDAWLNIKELSHIDNGVIELWDAYRDVQFSLAAMNIQIDTVENLKRKIEQLQFRVKQLEIKNAELQDELSLYVDYTPLKKVG